MSVSDVEWVADGVRAELTYTARTIEPLYNHYAEPPVDRPLSNEIPETHVFTISNLRDLPEPATLDQHGFELTTFETAISDIYDHALRKTIYEPEVEALVKRVTGAIRVVVFNHFLRGEEAQRRDPAAIAAPATAVHVDNTANTGPVFFNSILGEEATALRGRRFALVNVWRPITGPLQDRPLALCDARSALPEDLMVSSTISRLDRNGIYSAHGRIERAEIYSVAFNPGHRWYYAPDMTPDEALLIKCYDSDPRTARFAPHSAFVDPTTPPDAPPRASIEVRTLVVW